MLIKTFFFRYNGKPSDSLASLRHIKYIEMVATCNEVEPENLPPTERATYFHALRVNLQVCQWMNLDLHCLEVRVRKLEQLQQVHRTCLPEES